MPIALNPLKLNTDDFDELVKTSGEGLADPRAGIRGQVAKGGEQLISEVGRTHKQHHRG